MKDDCCESYHASAEVTQVPGWIKRLHEVTKTLAECHGMLDNVVGHEASNEGEVCKEPSCYAAAMDQEFRELELYARHLAERIERLVRLF